MTRGAWWRLQGEALQRREAAKCPPHPEHLAIWHDGDYATPDRRVCGRCFTTLEVRWPSRRQVQR